MAHALPINAAVDVKQALRLVDHRLASTEPHEAGDLVLLLVDLTAKAKQMATAQLSDVKAFLLKLEGVQQICRSALPDSARAGMCRRRSSRG